ncbi:MAG: ISAzo13 family transposase [Gemmatimonas sp.]|nr:ISAzo13 family transposase [Gemmatimonas sp.]
MAQARTGRRPAHRPPPRGRSGDGASRPAGTARGQHRAGPGAQAGRRPQAPGKKTPEVIQEIEKLLEHDRAGCPQTGLQWTRRTTGKIAAELGKIGILVSANTVGRLLEGLGFALRVNHKKLSRGSAPDRDEQFRYLAELRERFKRDGQPIISIDTKKKELIGNFKNPGRVWGRSPHKVNDHDFRSDAEALAVPYGIYDVLANRGSLYVGTSSDTPAFACANLERWWREEGEARYPDATELLILADCGGSNGNRVRAFKYGLQRGLCDTHCLVVTMAHYPAGASKWNPIEHRLFSEISKNWAGRPLDSIKTLLAYAASTRTETGLEVTAQRVEGRFETGEKISKAQMKKLDLEPHQVQPNRNYTLYPRL